MRSCYRILRYRSLVQIKEVLSSDESVEYLDLLDAENLAQNSDAVLILGQYGAAIQQSKEKYYRRTSVTHTYHWFTQENEPS
jgi:hypothetical protein